MRFALRLLIAAIIAGMCGFAVDQAVIAYAHIEPNGAECLGIAAWAASLLVLIAVMGRQAREWR